MPRRRDYLRLFEPEGEKEPHTRKQMLRDWDAVWAGLPDVDARFVKETREKLECSRSLFARRLCINERTLENWEQGRAKPNAQAVVLLLLVRHFPDTLERLRRIASPDPTRQKRTRQEEFKKMQSSQS